MRSRVEHVTIPPGCSIRVYNRRIQDIPFEWHHHPEFELTLTLNSRGLRFIGDHVGHYGPKDLVLIPSEMPHTWVSSAAVEPMLPHQAVVLWFTYRWAAQMAQLCPEYAALSGLLKRSGGALRFSTKEADLMLERMPELLSKSSAVRVSAALAILVDLAEAEGVPLASVVKPRCANPGDFPQLNRVLDTLHQRYAEAIRVEDLCEAGNISPRTLHRMFVSQMGESFSDYLRKLRVGHACMLLVETDLPVSAIAIRAGFNTLSNFNRAFRKTRQMTPLELRRFVKRNGRMPKNAPVIETADEERSYILRRDKFRQRLGRNTLAES